MIVRILLALLFAFAMTLAGCQVVQTPDATPTPVALATAAEQPPTPTVTLAPPTITPSPVSLPTSPVQATSAALFATSTALAATSGALTGNSGAGPAQRPRELPKTGDAASPRGGLAVLTLVLLTLGAWLRRRARFAA